MEGKWTSTKNSMVYIAAHAFPDEDYQYKDNRDYNCNDLQCSHHKKQHILLFMRSTASRWSRNRQRCPRTNFSDIELCSSLHIMSMFMPTLHFLHFFPVNKQAAGILIFPQCKLYTKLHAVQFGKNQSHRAQWMDVRTSPTQLLIYIFILYNYTACCHSCAFTSSSCWRHSKEKVICKIRGYK